MNPMDHISVWQAALVVSMGLAFIIGRPRASIIFVMCLNLGATMIFAANYPTIMVLDVTCAAILMGRGARADFVALLFALMVPFYVPAIIGGWEVGTTYAIIEAFSYLQLAIIGGAGSGYVSRYFGRDYLSGGYLGSIAQRRYNLRIDQPYSGQERISKRSLD